MVDRSKTLKNIFEVVKFDIAQSPKKKVISKLELEGRHRYKNLGEIELENFLNEKKRKK